MMYKRVKSPPKYRRGKFNWLAVSE